MASKFSFKSRFNRTTKKVETTETQEEEEEVIYPNRMDIENGRITNSTNNRTILSNRKTSIGLSKATVMDLLSNYKYIEPEDITSLSNGQGLWYRCIRFNPRTGRLKKFIRGGFLIHQAIGGDANEFIVLKNVSVNYTFSLPTQEVHLFQSRRKNELVNPIITAFVEDYTFIGTGFKPNTIMKKDLTSFSRFEDFNTLIKGTEGLKKRSVNNIITGSRQRQDYKEYYLLYVPDEREQEFNDDFIIYNTTQLELNLELERIEEIVDLFY